MRSLDFDARLAALVGRIDAALELAREPSSASPLVSANAELEALTRKLRSAEDNVLLQARRSQSLEDQVAVLEAELAAAHRRRREAETLAEAAQAQAADACARLERFHEQDDSVEGRLTQTLQAKLLEIERLTSELTGLRRSSDEWRGRAREFRRELDSITGKYEKAARSLSDLEQREAAASKRVAELEKIVAEQTRELAVAERRTKHLREHMAVRSSG